jgi:hypothetical protein|tara:strand:+ start:9476 stop:9667 length:192 start_codon:yes stop_codon:yes gene_type:complete
MYTLAKELNIPPHELSNYPISLVTDLMTIFTEIKTYEAEMLDKATKNTSSSPNISSKDGVNFG